MNNIKTISRWALALPLTLGLVAMACQINLPGNIQDFSTMCSARAFQGVVLQEIGADYAENGTFRDLRFDIETGTFSLGIEMWNLGASAQSSIYHAPGCNYQGEITGHLTGVRRGGIEFEGQGRVTATAETESCPPTSEAIYASLVLSDSCEEVIGYWIHSASEVGGNGKLISTYYLEDTDSNPDVTIYPNPTPSPTPTHQPAPTDEIEETPHPNSDATIVPDVDETPEPSPEPTPQKR